MPFGRVNELTLVGAGSTDITVRSSSASRPRRKDGLRAVFRRVLCRREPDVLCRNHRPPKNRINDLNFIDAIPGSEYEGLFSAIPFDVLANELHAAPLRQRVAHRPYLRTLPLK